MYPGILILVGLILGGTLGVAIMAIMTVGKEEHPPASIPLWQFVEKYVGHNSVVRLYREEIKIENGLRKRYLYPLETVMDWQISYASGDEDYFRAHPDVKKSAYRNAPVLKIIGGTEGFHTLDEIALVLDIKEVQK